MSDLDKSRCGEENREREESLGFCRAHKQWQTVAGAYKAEVYCRKGSEADRLQQLCPALQELYTPPLWARNNHVHLISATGWFHGLPAVLNSLGPTHELGLKGFLHCAVLRGLLHSPNYKRQIVHCEDGGTIALDWYDASDTCQDAQRSPTTPVVLVLHPLTGMLQWQWLQRPVQLLLCLLPSTDDDGAHVPAQTQIMHVPIYLQLLTQALGCSGFLRCLSQVDVPCCSSPEVPCSGVQLQVL